MKILSVCPNPSVDITLSVDELLTGCTNRTDNDVVETYSGKAINVIKALSKLGCNSDLCGFMFKDDLQSFLNDLSNYNCNCNFTVLDGKVRRNIKICDKNGKLTEINSSGIELDSQQRKLLLDSISDLSKDSDAVIISGSLPKNTPIDYYKDCFMSCKKNTLKVADTSGKALESVVSLPVDLIKPNYEELFGFFNKEFKSTDEMKKACFSINKMGVKYVLLSLGDKGAMLCTDNKAYFASAPKVSAKSTVGAGDSMLACAVFSILSGNSNEDIIKNAVACGTAAVLSEGTNLFSIEDYKNMSAKVITSLL